MGTARNAARLLIGGGGTSGTAGAGTLGAPLAGGAFAGGRGGGGRGAPPPRPCCARALPGPGPAREAPRGGADAAAAASAGVDDDTSRRAARDTRGTASHGGATRRSCCLQAARASDGRGARRAGATRQRRSTKTGEVRAPLSLANALRCTSVRCRTRHELTPHAPHEGGGGELQAAHHARVATPHAGKRQQAAGELTRPFSSFGFAPALLLLSTACTAVAGVSCAARSAAPACVAGLRRGGGTAGDERREGGRPT
jgi:hypothetical protein